MSQAHCTDPGVVPQRWHDFVRRRAHLNDTNIHDSNNDNNNDNDNNAQTYTITHTDNL